MNPSSTTPDTIDLLWQMVATPSVSGNEAAVSALLAEFLHSHGLQPERLGDNLVVRIKSENPGPTFLLNSHLDTVPAKEGWDTNPWGPEIIDGRLVGLGSGDAKASVAAMASTAVKLAQSGIPCGELVFAATVLEETGGGGLEEIRPSLGHLDAAFVGEPTNLQGAVAQGGLMILEATAHGKTAHSARANLGINALNIAAKDLLAIEALQLERSHPFLGLSSANVTVIQGGDRHNVIPDTCHYTVDIRYTPAYTPNELFEILNHITKASLRIRSERLIPVETLPKDPLIKALLHTAPDTSLFGSPTMSDWVHLAGTPAVKIGPGQSERSHTPNESVEVAQVLDAVSLYTNAITSYFHAHQEQP